MSKSLNLYMGDDYKEFTDKLKAIGDYLHEQGVPDMKTKLGTPSMSAVVRYLVDEELKKISKKEVFITIPLDVLWTDADPDEYMVEVTENNFELALEKELYKKGYDAKISWTSASSLEIADDNGAITGMDYDIIMMIFDSIDIEYVEIED